MPDFSIRTLPVRGRATGRRRAPTPSQPPPIVERDQHRASAFPAYNGAVSWGGPAHRTQHNTDTLRAPAPRRFP